MLTMDVDVDGDGTGMRKEDVNFFFCLEVATSTPYRYCNSCGMPGS
jgi:hypothetical protein